MGKRRGSIEDLVADLQEVRDELELQLHLASAEARNEWEGLEEKWRDLRARADRVGRAAGEAAENLGEALELLAEELKRGYERIRRSL